MAKKPANGDDKASMNKDELKHEMAHELARLKFKIDRLTAKQDSIRKELLGVAKIDESFLIDLGEAKFVDGLARLRARLHCTVYGGAG